MQNARLEHVNITVTDPKTSAAMLADLFGWSIRWEGASMDKGYTVHIGSDEDYIALYSNKHMTKPEGRSYERLGGLNHIAIVVDDLDALEAKVLAAGFKTENHGDYEPGRRFYFRDTDNIEYEIISYAAKG